jgi:CyaY protein
MEENPVICNLKIGPDSRTITSFNQDKIMNAPSFSVIAEQTLEQIAESLEELEALEDADIDMIDGVLTVEFEDGSQMILNRQEAAGQIWLASPEGPAHFGQSGDGDEWLNDKNGEELITVLGRIISNKTGTSVSLR